jgi:DNA polymerase-3 subunit beta
MKFIINSSILEQKFKLLIGVVNSHNIIPILDNFFLQIKKNKLFIRASNLEVTMETNVKIKSNFNGEIIIPAKLITNIIKTFEEQPLTFKVKKNILKIYSNKGCYSLIIQNSEFFPKSDFGKNEIILSIKSEIFLKIINKTLFAIGNDNFRPILNGIFFDFNKKESNFISTDMNKLIKYTRKDIKYKKNINFIVPKTPIVLIKNILNNLKKKSLIFIKYNKINIKFIINKNILECRLINGIYPKYKNIIPKKNNKKLILNRISFINSIKRLSFFSNKKTHQINLEIKKKKVKIKAEDSDFNKKAIEKIDCNYIGNDIKIGFNSNFLLELLYHLDSEDISIEMDNPTKISILKPIIFNFKKEKIIMLLVPMILKNN